MALEMSVSRRRKESEEIIAPTSLSGSSRAEPTRRALILGSRCAISLS